MRRLLAARVALCNALLPLSTEPPLSLHRCSLYEHAALTAGGSLAAAEALCAGEARLAVHWDGGRHHAGKGKAAGFCYVNDVVSFGLAQRCP